MAKRIIVAILSLAFVLGLLTGCGKTRGGYDCGSDWGFGYDAISSGFSSSRGGFSSGGGFRSFSAPKPAAPAFKAPSVQSPIKPGPKPGVQPLAPTGGGSTTYHDDHYYNAPGPQPWYGPWFGGSNGGCR